MRAAHTNVEVVKLALRNWEFRRWWWLTIDVRRWWILTPDTFIFNGLTINKREGSVSIAWRFAVAVVVVVETDDVDVMVNELNEVSNRNDDILTVKIKINRKKFQWKNVYYKWNTNRSCYAIYSNRCHCCCWWPLIMSQIRWHIDVEEHEEKRDSY